MTVAAKMTKKEVLSIKRTPDFELKSVFGERRKNELKKWENRGLGILLMREKRETFK